MNKVPSNILTFAGGEKNLAPYLQFRDYWNHYRSMNGAKNISFATMDDKGQPISFDEKEALMNATLKREIARVANVSFADFPLESYVLNPMVSWATMAVVSAMIDMILPESIVDTVGLYTDVRNGNFGDSFAFDVKPRDLFVVSKSGKGQKTSEVHKTFNGQVTILPEMHQLTIGVSLYKVLAGTESLADFTAKAIKSIETRMTLDCYDAFAATMAAVSNTATTGLRHAGYTQADLVSLAQRVTAWNGGSKAVIVGTQLALVNVLPEDANYRYTLNDEFVTLGYIRQAFGFDVICLPQVVDLTTPFGSAISDSYLWVLSPASQKILKLCLEGNTMSNTTAPFENANLTQNTTIWKSWGVGVATNVVAGVITL